MKNMRKQFAFLLTFLITMPFMQAYPDGASGWRTYDIHYPLAKKAFNTLGILGLVCAKISTSNDDFEQNAFVLPYTLGIYCANRAFDYARSAHYDNYLRVSKYDNENELYAKSSNKRNCWAIFSILSFGAAAYMFSINS